MATIHTLHESARGCGFRKAGGLYLVADQLSLPCPKLPIELAVCPTCGEGVKQTRGFTWIKPDPLLDPGAHGTLDHSVVCPLGHAMQRDVWSTGERAGLLWIGAQFYSHPQTFMREAAAMGVSRRIRQVPRDLKIGETWIALAHPRAVPGECPHGAPAGQLCTRCAGGISRGQWHGGVVTFFRPTAIEYVVRGDETDDELDRLEGRGFRLVRVVKVGEQLDGEAA